MSHNLLKEHSDLPYVNITVAHSDSYQIKYTYETHDTNSSNMQSLLSPNSEAESRTDYSMKGNCKKGLH